MLCLSGTQHMFRLRDLMRLQAGLLSLMGTARNCSSPERPGSCQVGISCTALRRPGLQTYLDHKLCTPRQTAGQRSFRDDTCAQAGGRPRSNDPRCRAHIALASCLGLSRWLERLSSSQEHKDNHVYPWSLLQMLSAGRHRKGDRPCMACSVSCPCTAQARMASMSWTQAHTPRCIRSRAATWGANQVGRPCPRCNSAVQCALAHPRSLSTRIGNRSGLLDASR